MRASLFVALLLAPALAWAQPADVRVRLGGTSPARSAVVSGDGLTVDASGELVDAARVELAIRGGDVRVSAAGRTFQADRVTVRAAGPLALRAGRLDRSYSGHLTATVEGGRLQLVNHVPFVDYVASVVASEYPFSEIEGIKAQAVLARTYASRRLDPTAAFDVDDHEGAQVYKGAGVVTERAWQAAVETQGERLYYGDELAEAVYSSSSGGHTADNETIWDGRPLPYLRGVPDPYDADAPDHRWTTTASATALHRALQRRFGGSVRGVEVADVSPEGRVRRVQLVGSKTITGSQFRATVNAALGYRTVRSTFFDLDRRGGEYVLRGRGFGHGVGMSQYGARAQARAGRTYLDILDFYYGGTRVVADPSAGNVATTAPRWPTPRGRARADKEETTVRRRPTPRREARARRGW